MPIGNGNVIRVTNDIAAFAARGIGVASRLLFCVAVRSEQLPAHCVIAGDQCIGSLADSSAHHEARIFRAT